VSTADTIADAARGQLRLQILQGLAASADYTAHEYVLRDLLDAAGIRVGAGAVRHALQWLGDAGLIRLDQCGDGWVATLREAGADVAEGRATRDGIARPRPAR
jgi:Fe2+ or Zn2+ uptake regulation protein